MGQRGLVCLVAALAACGGDDGSGDGAAADAEPRCSAQDDCPDEEPLCEITSGECGPCIDGSNCSGHPPYCVDGACVGCGEPGVSAFCQPLGFVACGENGRCRGCEANAECDSGACLRGECAAEEDVLYVEPGGSAASDCTRADPCDTIARAIEVAAGGTRTVIALADGVYQEAVAVTPTTYPEGVRLALVGGEATTIQRPTSGPVIRVRDVSLELERITITGGTGASGAGIQCERMAASYVGLLTRQLTIRDNAGAGIVSSGCDLEVVTGTVSDNGGDGVRADGVAGTSIGQSVIDGNGGVGMIATVELATLLGSWVRGNAAGGVVIDAGLVLIDTVVIAGNGNLVDTQSAGLTVAVSEVDPLEIFYATVAENRTAGSAGAGIACAGPVASRNSIVWGNQGGDQLDPDCQASYTLVSGAAPPGTGNLTGEPDFIDPASGDYSIGPGSDAIDRGDPAATGGFDINGDRRGKGTLADLGADEYVP